MGSHKPLLRIQVIYLLIILSFPLLTSPVIGQSEEKCYVVVDSSKDIDPSLLSNISIPLISKFVRDVEQVPTSGISVDSCQYQISVSKNNDTIFVTLKGEGLNSYSDSKLSGSEGFQQVILKSLYRSLKEKRDIICQEYRALLEECNEVVNKHSGILYGTYSKTKWEDGGEWKWYKNDNDNRYGRYKGEIEDYLPNGKGIIKTTTGITYLGEFKYGLPNGQGITIYPDGETYIGKYMKGIRNGQITHTFPSGQKYEGELKDGNSHGKGTYTFPDGESYVGKFKDGKENGQGTYSWSDGETYVGEFKDDKIWTGIYYTKYGIITEKIRNGKSIKQ